MLSGVRVVEIEGLGPGPFAAMMLADLGADVVVIHRPGKPDALTSDPSLLDRGKRSILLDLKDAEDLAVARALIAGSSIPRTVSPCSRSRRFRPSCCGTMPRARQ